MKFLIKNLLFLVSFFIFFYIFSTAKIYAQIQSDSSKINALIESAISKEKSLDDAIKILNDALLMSDNIHYLTGKADALHMLGKVYTKQGEYSKAMNYLFEELKMRGENPGWNSVLFENNYSMIGETFRAIGNYDMSLEYLNKALNLSEKIKDDYGTAYIYNRLASVYHELSYKIPDTSSSFKAVELAEKSIEIAKRFNNNNELLISNLNVIGAACTFRSENTIALKYFLLAFNEAEKDSTYMDKPNIMNNIAALYNQLGEYDKAIEYASNSHSISDKSGIKVYRLESARCLIKSYLKTGKYKEACEYYEEASGLALDLYSVKKAAEISGLQNKFEDEIKKQNDSTAANIKIIMGGVLVIIIISAGTGFFIKHRDQIKLNKQLEAKNELILQQKEQLAHSNATKDKFFSILSHDLRNPLNGLLGFSNLLEVEFDNIKDEEKKEYIGYIKSSSESLNKLIDKTLMWSRLQTGKINVHKEKINLQEIVSSAVELQKVNAIRKGIILENNISFDLFVDTDKNILDIILRNLIDNAIKFTDEGGKVSVNAEDTDGYVMLLISDTGVGMTESQLKKLFRIEEKMVSRGTHNEEGSGLGLILCKEMLALMNSDLKVESKKSEGSKFYFMLPQIA